MNKKSGGMIFLLACATAGVLVAGQWHSQQQQKQLEEKSKVYAESSYYQGKTNHSTSDETTLSKEERIKEYEKNSQNLSVRDYLDYLLLKEGTAKLGYYGHLSAEEDWVKDLERQISEDQEQELEFVHSSFEDTNTYSMYIQQTMDFIKAEKPNVLLIRTSPYADRKQDMGLDETETYFKNLLEDLQRALPESRIIFVETLTAPANASVRNSRSLSTDNYADRMKKTAEEAGVTVLPLREKAEEEIAALFDSDGEELSDEGNTKYAEWIMESFSK